MRADVALILIGMGYVPEVDFRAVQVGPTDVAVTWLSGSPQPTPAEIDAAIAANPTIYADRLETNARTATSTSVGSDTGSVYRAVRAAAAVLVDEVNTLLAALPRPITSITRSGNTATATTPAAHGLSNGTIAIFGSVQAAYNGTQTITVTGTTTFTFTVAGNPTTPATGTILYALAGASAPLSRTLAQAKTAMQNKITSGAV